MPVKKTASFRLKRLNRYWLVFAIIVLMIRALPVSAHRVIVFAWIEEERVHTVSKFSGGKKVKNGLIRVYDLAGAPLLEGRTNENGEFSFALPPSTGLKIVLDAGMGHRGEWKIAAEEMKPEPTPKTVPPASDAAQTPSKPSSGEAPRASGPPRLRLEDIEAAMEKALDKKLAPLLQMLAESRQPGPDARDIFAGIGYVCGLVGIGAYVNYRRSRK